MNTYSRVPLALVLLFAVVPILSGCGDEATDIAANIKAAGETAEAFSDAMQAAKERAQQIEGKITEPVDFAELQALLPEQLPGMERTSYEGSSTERMGVSMASATATYTAEDGPHVTLTITDMGSMSGLAMFGYAWAMGDFERVSSSGYERTITYHGYEGYEKYNKKQKHGVMNVLVADRFIVAAEGWFVEMDAVKGALDRIDLEALEAMKDVGVSEAP